MSRPDAPRLETQQACDVEVADLDSDNLDDVLICQDHGEKSSTFYSLIFRGSAGGTLDEVVQVESLSAQRVLVGRTSKTRSPDVIFVNREARGTTEGVDVALYLGGPDGFLADRRVDLPARSAVAAIGADINDDGRADLIIANCSEENTALDPGSFVYLAGNGGFPDRPSMKIPTARAHGTACADLNRDGYLDLVFVGFSNPDIQVFYGNREGTFCATGFRMEADGQVYDEPRWPHLADLNRDGWLDLIVPQIAYDRSLVLWGSEQGFSMARRQMLSVWHGSFANAADLDGNGWIDPVIGGHIPSRDVPHDSFLHIHWNGPKGLREDRRTQLPGNGINAVGIRDFNNDTFLDILVANYHDNRARDIDSYIYWGSRSGFSESRRQRLFSHSASGSNANDFNEDGWVDLVIANHKVEGHHVGFSSVWWNGPKGFSEERTTRLPSRGPHGMTVIDPGNQVDRGPEEFYVSAPFELPGEARVTRAECEAEIPAKTWVRLQLRFAASRTEL